MSVEQVTEPFTHPRLLHWDQLRELAGYKVAPSVRDQIAYELEDDFEAKAAALRGEYEAKIAELKTTYPQIIARRMAEGLINSSRGGQETVGEVLKRASSTPGLKPVSLTEEAKALLSGDGGGAAVAAPPAPAEGVTPVEAAPAAAPAVEDDDDDLVMEPYIETARCTTCNECTAINGQLFKYNADKQAEISDAKAGTFAQLVKAAELCPARCIHPGKPRSDDSTATPELIERAKPFN